MEIGLDPRLHSETAVKPIATASAKGARLVLLDENPLDADWYDRPDLPDTPVVIQPTRFAGRSSEQKRKALAAQMKAAGHDMLLVAQPENIAWLLNIHAPPMCRIRRLPCLSDCSIKMAALIGLFAKAVSTRRCARILAAACACIDKGRYA